MKAETFTEYKNKLEEFYKQRNRFNISNIEIKQSIQILASTHTQTIYILELILNLREIDFQSVIYFKI